MLRALEKLLAPIKRRIAMMVSRGVVSLVNDALKLQGLQIAAFADETLDEIERFQQYGLTSHPLPGAEAIVLSLGGARSHSVVIAADDRRHRKTNLAAGEVALYTDEGDMVLLKRGRIVEITAGTKVKVTAPQVEVVATTKVQMTTPLVEITGNLNVGGAVVAQGNVTAGTIGLQTHRHGGVSPGGSLTAVPQP